MSNEIDEETLQELRDDDQIGYIVEAFINARERVGDDSDTEGGDRRVRA